MRKKINFEKSICSVLLLISADYNISNNSVYYLKKITFYICEYVVNYNSKNKNKKNLLIERDLYSSIYNMFTPSNANSIVNHMKTNKNIIKKNLYFSETYINDVIKSITKRPFKYDYIILLTYLIEFINHEILEQAIFQSRENNNFITKDIIINVIKQDIDLNNIVNMLNMKLVTENRMNNIFSREILERLIAYNCNNKILDSNAIEFLVHYIGTKIDNMINNIKVQTNNDDIFNTITNTDVINNLRFLI